MGSILHANLGNPGLERAFHDKGIWRSESIVLPTGGRIFARRTFYGDAAFLTAIHPILVRLRPGLARVLAAMQQHDAIDIDTVKKLLAVKLDAYGSGRSFDRELAAIVEAGIGTTDNAGTGRLRLVRRKHVGTDEGRNLGFHLYAEQETERRLLSLLIRHYRQQNLIAWNTPEPMEPRPYNNGQIFSAFAYSHLRPLRKVYKGKRKACPVPFEVLARSAEQYDVAGFIERLHRAGDHTRSRLRLLGVMGARSFSPEAFKLGRDFGLAMVNFRELFGQATLDTLATAQALLAGVADPETVANGATPDILAGKLAESIAELKNNPLVSDLCGMALETFAVAALRGANVEGVRANVHVPFAEHGSLSSREVDVCGFNDETWHVIECKALNADKELPVEYVNRFFKETLPAFLSDVGKNKVKICHAELWTTGKVSSELRAHLTTLRLDGRVKREIRTRDSIPVPAKISSLSRILDVIAQL